MNQIRCILILITFVLTTSFNFQTKYDKSNLSALIIKIKYNSYGIAGFGGKLKIRNIESNEIFESKSKKGFNPYVIIENLPNGKYFIEELQIIYGPSLLIVRGDLSFNDIVIDTSKIYYLGSYLTKKIPPLKLLNFQIVKKESDNVEKIYEQIKKRSSNWSEMKIDYEQSLFKVDTTNIEIRNNR